ncbi:hypothetical protein J7J00_16160 [Bacillus sp. ISL-4]|nr:hypothetical protein [Bacillus sp. ISL-4]MBT2670445.1 hypothetical protein [Streptomyces sp. ISL-14]
MTIDPRNTEYVREKRIQVNEAHHFFINIGRRNPVIQNEWFTRLWTKILQVLDFDVFETEPLPENSPLWELNNVIITPHTSGNTEFYDQRLRCFHAEFKELSKCKKTFNEFA